MVIWSKPAKADLRSIHDFIAHDSRHYAKKVTQDIAAKTDILDELPRMGKRVPELNNENIPLQADGVSVVGSLSGEHVRLKPHLLTLRLRSGRTELIKKMKGSPLSLLLVYYLSYTCFSITRVLP